MKNYKEFGKTYIGESDRNFLTLKSGRKRCQLNFGRSGRYRAYICFGDDVEIAKPYKKVFSGKDVLTIYDDYALTYREFFIPLYSYVIYTKVDVYRAGKDGCVIHWHK